MARKIEKQSALEICEGCHMHAHIRLANGRVTREYVDKRGLTQTVRRLTSESTIRGTDGMHLLAEIAQANLPHAFFSASAREAREEAVLEYHGVPANRLAFAEILSRGLNPN